MKKLITRIAESEYIIIVLAGLVLLISWLFKLSFAAGISRNFWTFFVEMVTFLPLMFILIGLIDVWFPREKVEKHIGQEAGMKGTVWVILLAMLQAGPLYGAFPVAHLLWKKGSSIRNIFIYLGAFATMKLPMLTFEVGFLGLKFSLLRTLFTLPVFILMAMFMEFYLKDKGFEVYQPAVQGKKAGRS
jgi:uncharacterized membrane protein YraQ (UPF0718 family)